MKSPLLTRRVNEQARLEADVVRLAVELAQLQVLALLANSKVTSAQKKHTKAVRARRPHAHRAP